MKVLNETVTCVLYELRVYAIEFFISFQLAYGRIWSNNWKQLKSVYYEVYLKQEHLPTTLQMTQPIL